MIRFLSRLTRLIILLIPILFPTSLHAGGFSGISIALSAGLTFDITTYGIEQVYAAFQGEFLLPGNPSLALKPSLSYNGTSAMFRLPVTGKIELLKSSDELILLSGYFGGGLEYFHSAEHNEFSPLITGGLTLQAGRIYIDLPGATAFRSYNTDSDVSVTAGMSFNL